MRKSMSELRAILYQKRSQAAINLPSLKEITSLLPSMDIYQMAASINSLENLIDRKTISPRKREIGERVDLYTEEIERRLQVINKGVLPTDHLRLTSNGRGIMVIKSIPAQD